MVVEVVGGFLFTIHLGLYSVSDSMLLTSTSIIFNFVEWSGSSKKKKGGGVLHHISCDTGYV